MISHIKASIKKILPSYPVKFRFLNINQNTQIKPKRLRNLFISVPSRVILHWTLEKQQ